MRISFSNSAEHSFPTSMTRRILPNIDFARRRANRALPTTRLLALLKNSAPLLYQLAEVVGQWVWIEFNEAPPRPIRAQISQFGFHWNARRRLWQHPCGVFSERSRNDPRKKYRSYLAARQEAV